MVTRYLLPALAVVGIILGSIAIYLSQREPPTPPIPFAPPKPPFEHNVAGEGLVEAASENIEIGTPLSEIVERVFVIGGDYVRQGMPLFQLNTTLLQARLAESKAALQVAQAEYKKQLDLPRPEDIPPREAVVKQHEALLLDKVKQFEIVDKLENPKAVSRDEYNQRKYAALLAKYELEEAEEELALLLAGAWIRDLDIYRARLKEAKANVEVVEQEIERSTVRAPFDGYVLRVNIHEGEFAQASELVTPLMIFGSTGPFHIRVDIDEEDAWRVIKGAPGVAYVRGNSSLHVPLKYVRLEPYLIPKESLTGDTSERVDTRVLQVIYQFEHNDLPIYPGMLMDVFLEGKPNRNRNT